MIGVLSLFLLFVALIDRSLGEVKTNYPQQVHQYSKSLGLLYSQYIQRCWETACQQAPYPPPIILKFCPHPRARLGQFQSQELATSAWALGRFQDRYLSIMRAILEEARPTQRLVLGIGRRMGTTWGLTLKHDFAVWSPTMIITRFSPTYTYIST